MGSGGMIYIPSFIKVVSDIQKLIRGIHRQHGDHTSLFSFFQDKKSRLKSGRWIMSKKGVIVLMESVLCTDTTPPLCVDLGSSYQKRHEDRWGIFSIK
jgi:hypothetical protein